MGAMLAYCLLPLLWLFISATKSPKDLYSTFGLWFSTHNSLLSNVRSTLTYAHGEFLHWAVNSLVYSLSGAAGASILAALAGYGFSRFSFKSRTGLYRMILVVVMVPSTALVLPTFLLAASLGLTNTRASVILPSMVNPFAVYLMTVYVAGAVPISLLEAARIDGAGELRIFWTIARPLLSPGIVTVFLISLVANWNNFLLPLIMLNSDGLLPITVGLARWQGLSTLGAGGINLTPLVLTGSVLSLVPLLAAFLLLQRYWQSGLASGAVKG